MARCRTTSPIELEWDEDGLHIQVDTSELRYVVLELDGATMRGVMSSGDAWDFYEHVRDVLGDWYAEGAAVQREVEQARDDEDTGYEDTGYALDDPKHPTYRDRMSGIHDSRDGK